MEQSWMLTCKVELRSSVMFELDYDNTVLNLLQSLPTNLNNPAKFIINSLTIPLAVQDAFRTMDFWKDPTGAKGEAHLVIKVILDGLNNPESDWADSITCHWLDQRSGFYVMVDVTFVGHKLSGDIMCTVDETICECIEKFANIIPAKYNYFHHTKYHFYIQKYKVNISIG
ncbi:U1 protein [Beatrice Hill virus]|uniref:U1 protein n=1 Tax=Beatrice Hill virus TaxID=1819301 RepID=A0A1J0F5E0_9RHAB|nr:U1 protein [Beatrice Hill virus]APC23641.1 U1 protein [Beatrice Hill virus]